MTTCSIDLRRISLPTVTLLLVLGSWVGSQSALSARGDAAASSPADAQLTWLVDMLNGGSTNLTDADVAAHLAPQLLAVLPAPALIETLQQLAALGPLALKGLTRPATSHQEIGLLTTPGSGSFVLPVSVEASLPYRITGLSLDPVPVPDGVVLKPFVSGVDPRRYDAQVNVGGRLIELSCFGMGSPTVLLESGLGDSGAPWFGIQTAIADFTRVCSYDRSNTGASASDDAAKPRTGLEVASDLATMLEASGEPGPYVLVGHSIGSHVIRLFAAEHGDKVAGMVLVDPTHEDQDLRRKALVTPDQFKVLKAILSANQEGVDLDATADEVRAARSVGPLPAVPLFVVSAGIEDDASQFPPGWPMKVEAKLHHELQADLVTLIPGGRQIVATKSTHYVHRTQPDLVVDAIRQAVTAARLRHE
jgi:pimeloyl-ACP methyl ester carboxylesterase